MAAAKDNMGNGAYGWESPANNAAVVSPSDSTDLAYITRALIIGTAGDIKVTTAGGQTLVLPNVPAGILPLRVSRVFSTATVADDITALW